VSLSSRDRKILLALVPILVVGGLWFLLLAPKRSEVGRLTDQLTGVQQKRDDAVARLGQLGAAQKTYAKDYETVVRLGKAVPSTLDMPSLLVQLDHAAKGTGIDFTSVKAGSRAAASPTTPAPAAQAGSGAAGGEKASAAGGKPAQTDSGKAAESANGASKASQQGSTASGAQPGAAGSSSSSAPTTAGAGAPGLDTVPLDFTFTGSFFDLADFFHRMKRFVRVANSEVEVRGRLMTIDGLGIKSESFPKMTASVKATVYLSPKTEGATAAATPTGPTAAGATPPAAPGAAPSSTTTPAGGGRPQ